MTAQCVAAASDGLRWSGCDAIDAGPATAACLAFAMERFEADGALLIGNPGREAHRVGLQFWTAGPRPISAGNALRRIEHFFHAGVERPARANGSLRREPIDGPYLAALAEHYHALRPLRVMVDSASGPMVDHLKKLAATVACEILPCRAARSEWSRRVGASDVHLAARIDDDGEMCEVFDQRGQAVSAERLLAFLAGHALSDDRKTIVLEKTTSENIVRTVEGLGCRVATVGASRAEMSEAMSREKAALGGGPSGRFWHVLGGKPLPDALMTLTQLLVLLSRDDRPFSAVLDQESPLK